MKWKLPPVRNFGWTMKTLASAKTSFRVLPYGSFECCINHDIIKGCTTEMIEWWFKNIGGDMEYEGRRYSKYLVWHPKDHIQWELVQRSPDGSVGVGSKFRIVEAFNENINWIVDTVEDIVKLDRTGIRLRRKFLGIEVYCLEHRFIPAENGTIYISRLQVGAESIIGKYILNPIIQKYILNSEMAIAWLKHNIEEVGNFEYFLPELYSNEVTKPKKLFAQAV